MSGQLEQTLSPYLQRVPGLVAITVADKDGYPIVKVESGNSNDTVVLTQAKMANYSSGSEQADKLEMGDFKSGLITYDTFKVVYFDCDPLMVYMTATHDAESGYLLDLRSEIVQVIEPLRANFPKPQFDG
eukprot:m.116377 g.116377  ORF g.116377 m.116377 type:complete len:130 (-) comp28499_c1_seq1:52-441(-)